MAEVGGILATWKAEGGTRLPSGNNAVFSSKIAATGGRLHRALAVGSFRVFAPLAPLCGQLNPLLPAFAGCCHHKEIEQAFHLEELAAKKRRMRK
jgi:hypothetical protein